MRFRRSANALARRVLVPALPLLAIGLGEAQVIKATWQEYRRWSAGFVDVPEQVEHRVAPLRDLLPKYGRIGYIDPDHSWLNADATRAFYLTQYALAPRVMVYGSDTDYVIYSSHLGRPLNVGTIPSGMRVLSRISPSLAVLVRVPQ